MYGGAGLTQRVIATERHAASRQRWLSNEIIGGVSTLVLMVNCDSCGRPQAQQRAIKISYSDYKTLRDLNSQPEAIGSRFLIRFLSVIFLGGLGGAILGQYIFGSIFGFFLAIPILGIWIYSLFKKYLKDSFDTKTKVIAVAATYGYDWTSLSTIISLYKCTTGQYILAPL